MEKHYSQGMIPFEELLPPKNVDLYLARYRLNLDDIKVQLNKKRDEYHRLFEEYSKKKLFYQELIKRYEQAAKLVKS